MGYRLISFSTCPYVQRAVIVLQQKGVSFLMDYIDLAKKPNWFLKLSPRGKVPVLVADETPLFESAAICEFLDEVEQGQHRLVPEDALLRARDRAWFQMTSEDLLVPLYRMGVASDEEAFSKITKPLGESLSRLEKEMESRLYLSGSGACFGFADVGAAPFFFRLKRWEERGYWQPLRRFPLLQRYTDRLYELPYVKESVSSSFEQDEITQLARLQSYLLQKPAPL